VTAETVRASVCPEQKLRRLEAKTPASRAASGGPTGLQVGLAAKACRFCNRAHEPAAVPSPPPPPPIGADGEPHAVQTTPEDGDAGDDSWELVLLRCDHDPLMCDRVLLSFEKSGIIPALRPDCTPQPAAADEPSAPVFCARARACHHSPSMASVNRAELGPLLGPLLLASADDDTSARLAAGWVHSSRSEDTGGGIGRIGFEECVAVRRRAPVRRRRRGGGGEGPPDDSDSNAVVPVSSSSFEWAGVAAFTM
jgi:hypothetical protein